MDGPVEFPWGNPIQLAKPQWNSPSDVRKAEFHGVKMIRMGGWLPAEGNRSTAFEEHHVNLQLRWRFEERFA